MKLKGLQYVSQQHKTALKSVQRVKNGCLAKLQIILWVTVGHSVSIWGLWNDFCSGFFILTLLRSNSILTSPFQQTVFKHSLCAEQKISNRSKKTKLSQGTKHLYQIPFLLGSNISNRKNNQMNKNLHKYCITQTVKSESSSCSKRDFSFLWLIIFVHFTVKLKSTVS